MEIELTKGAKALIDLEDFELVSKHKWYHDGNYACTNASNNDVRKGKKRKVYLHRFILNAKEREEVDHINHNGLDNRKKNLRICSHRSNICNSVRSIKNKTGYRGVTFHKQSGKYNARVWDYGKAVSLGYFETAEEAKVVRDQVASEVYGISVN